MNLLLLKAVAGGGNPGALVIFISMIQFEMGDLIWILVGLLLGLAILTGVLCLPRSKPEREQPTDTIGAILVHSETAELLLVRYDLSGRMTFISQGCSCNSRLQPRGIHFREAPNPLLCRSR